MKTLDLFLRFVSPEPNSGCWLWTGGGGGAGYGRFSASRTMVMAHRFSYEAHVGPIPDGLQIDHLCRVRACVNPSHLEPVDARTNTLRGAGRTALNAKKEVCHRGHPLSPNYGGRSNRVCRVCDRERQERRKRARGVAPLGYARPRITDAQVVDIRRRAWADANGRIGNAEELAAEYGVSRRYIVRALRDRVIAS